MGGRGSAATRSSCSPFRNTHDTDDWVGQHDERERERVNNGERSDLPPPGNTPRHRVAALPVVHPTRTPRHTRGERGGGSSNGPPRSLPVALPTRSHVVGTRRPPLPHPPTHHHPPSPTHLPSPSTRNVSLESGARFLFSPTWFPTDAMTFSYKFRVAEKFNWVISGKLPGSSRFGRRWW